MSDWQPGDLALCIRDKPQKGPWLIKKGRIYTVSTVGRVGSTAALELKEDPYAVDYWWNAKAFIKITPPADMELEEASEPQTIDAKAKPGVVAS